MNTRSFSGDLFQICPDEIQEELEDLLDDPDDVPELEEFLDIYLKVADRKHVDSLPDGYNCQAMIKIVAETIPKLSFDGLKKEASKKNSKALLSLGDCFFFGLKGVRKDRKKARQFYLESAELNNPEAASMFAYICYSRLIEATNEKEGRPLPTVLYPSDKFLRIRGLMWTWLDKCATLDWISPFLLKQADDAKLNRPQELTPTVKRLVIKRDVDAQRRRMEKDLKFSFACENPTCFVKFDIESKLMKCSRCRIIKYCSKNCQIVHWPKHKDNCKPSLNPPPESNNSQPSQEGSTLFRLKVANQIVEIETRTLETELIKDMQRAAAKEEEESLILSRSRLATVRNNTMSLDEIKQEITRMFNRQSYPLAIKYINLAIAKLHQEKSFNKMSQENLIDLIELFSQRVECYLKIADSRRVQRYKEMALDDCVFVLETGVFDKIDCPGFKKLQEIKTKLESSRHETTSEQPARNRRRRRVNRDRQKISLAEDLSRFGKINVTTCSKLLKGKMALNSQIDIDFCPICSTEWSKFVEPSLVAILPCDHACCVKCMFSYNKACLSVQYEDKENAPNDSCCVLCRQDFSPLYLDDICNTIVKERVIATLFDHINKLPLSQQEREKLVFSLLMKNEFEVSKVESILFNMVGMVQAETVKNFDHEKKQEYFELARAPVIKLTQECNKLKHEMNSIFDTDSKEWKNKFKHLERLQNKLYEARRNSADDIFERMNSSGKMGLMDDNGLIQVDLHGLYINEAIEKVQEFVLPMLKLLKKIMLITGYGLHNLSGEANLKNGLKEYLKSNGIKSSEDEKNKVYLRSRD